jgi:hypothetical protein
MKRPGFCHFKQQLERHPYLSTFGLVVNSLIQNVICEFCRVTFQWDALDTHLKSKEHGGHHVRVDWDKYEEAKEEMGIADTLPCQPDGLFPHIQGLEVHDGIRCVICPKPFGTARSMELHHRSEHKGIPLPTEWPICKMQQFNRGNASKLFEIEFPAPPQQFSPPDDEALVADFTKDMEHVYVPPEDARQITPWLQKTGWHLHVAPFDIGELRSLAALPKGDEFPGLSAAVLSYFQAATDLIRSTDLLTLQYLNTEDPEKT